MDDSFLAIAEAKAAHYSRLGGGLAIATDAGAVFPGLKGWDPLTTKRFTDGDDRSRIDALLELMAGAEDRTVEWHEAIALAEDGEVIFSTQAKAMDGCIAEKFNPRFYREGIWLCSVTEFPLLGGRNYFELSPEEQALTEDSWTELREAFRQFARSQRL